MWLARANSSDAPERGPSHAPLVPPSPRQVILVSLLNNYSTLFSTGFKNFARRRVLARPSTMVKCVNATNIQTPKSPTTMTRQSDKSSTPCAWSAVPPAIARKCRQGLASDGGVDESRRQLEKGQESSKNDRWLSKVHRSFRAHNTNQLQHHASSISAVRSRIHQPVPARRPL